ncbi:MAG: ribosome recycling factor [Saccharofermentanales bacterium]
MIEITNDVFIPYENRMDKTVNVLKEDFNTIRAGRANPKVLDKIAIDYYGSSTPINQLANIQVPEARMITITPFDPTALKLIEKAIQTSELGINPNNDGKIIRLVFPTLTEERRKELTKTVAKHGEEAKIAIRNVRREALDKFKDMHKKKDISDDTLKEVELTIQQITDVYISEIDKLIADKDKDLLSV